MKDESKPNETTPDNHSVDSVADVRERERGVITRRNPEEIADFYDGTDEDDLDWTPSETAEIGDVGRVELQQISIRLPKEDLDALKRRARRSGVGYTTLLRMIVHEHVNSPLTR